LSLFLPEDKNLVSLAGEIVLPVQSSQVEVFGWSAYLDFFNRHTWLIPPSPRPPLLSDFDRRGGGARR